MYAVPTFSTKVYLKLIVPPMNSDSLTPDLSITSDRKLLRDLQARQVALEFKLIELEVQNEHLRSSQTQYEQSEGYYADLFNNAPVGHLTLTENELISEANKAATELFGIGNCQCSCRLGG